MTNAERAVWPPPTLHHPPSKHTGQWPAMSRPTTGAIPITAARSSAAHGRSIVVLLPLRIFLAAGWLRAGVEKVIEPTWWSGAKLRNFLSGHDALAVGFFRPVMRDVVAPNAVAIAAIVALAEVACGIAIGVGRSMQYALRVGVVLNIVFILCGQVNPSAFYLVMEAALLLAMADGAFSAPARPAGTRTLVSAGLAATFACLLVPYVRTVAPAAVIDDPAIMLVFLAFTLSGTLAFRWIVGHPKHATSARRWQTWVSDWAHARSRRAG